MAQNINKELVNVGFKDLGIIERPNLAVLRGTRMPAVLIETGFINTDADNRLFDEKNDEIAGGIADAIVRTVSGAAGTGVSMMSESETAIALDRNKTATVLLKRAADFTVYATADMKSMLMQGQRKIICSRMVLRRGLLYQQEYQSE